MDFLKYLCEHECFISISVVTPGQMPKRTNRFFVLLNIPHPTSPLALMLKCPCFPHSLPCLYLRSLSLVEPAARTPIWFPSPQPPLLPVPPPYLCMVNLLKALPLSWLPIVHTLDLVLRTTPPPAYFWAHYFPGNSNHECGLDWSWLVCIPSP